MNSEREAFEEWFESEYLNCKISELNDTEYWRELIQYSWEAWQASAQRQGYKLVPVEPTQNMIDKAVNDTPETPSQDYWHDSQPISDDQAISCYKAMIGEEN